MMMVIQNFIYKWEEGKGVATLKVGAGLMVFITLALIYDHRCYQNFNTQEAMDTAQLARNLSQNRGFTTHFIRPVDLYFLEKKNPSAPLNITSAHPDLANAPLYPVVLSAVMRASTLFQKIPYLQALSFNFEVPREQFRRHQPEILITVFNQVLFLAAIFLLFFLARKLFDSAVAWLSIVLFAGTELIWKASASGQSILFLIFLILILCHGLVFLETWSREPERSFRTLILLVIGMGLTTAAIFMTRYSAGLISVAVLAFIGIFVSRQWGVLGAVFLGVFLAGALPWLIRNYNLSGHYFGTAGFAMRQGTLSFPDNKFERSLDPEAGLKQAGWDSMMRKGVVNTRDMLKRDLPSFTGNWVAALFLASLLMPFRNPALSRFRWFLVFSLVIFCGFQPLGRTYLSDESPQINSENLLLLLAPPLFIYGCGVFYTLMDQFPWFATRLRPLGAGIFSLILSLPLVVSILPPRTFPIAYPPYNPVVLYTTGRWMQTNELTMSDIPWAAAWYGQRPCMWLTLNSEKDFFAVNDYQEPIRALYLTPKTLNAPFLTQMVKERGWGQFVLESVMNKEVPKGFPLKKAPAGFLPEQLFLTDRERWQNYPKDFEK